MCSEAAAVNDDRNPHTYTYTLRKRSQNLLHPSLLRSRRTRLELEKRKLTNVKRRQNVKINLLQSHRLYLCRHLDQLLRQEELETSKKEEERQQRLTSSSQSRVRRCFLLISADFLLFFNETSGSTVNPHSQIHLHKACTEFRTMRSGNPSVIACNWLANQRMTCVNSRLCNSLSSMTLDDYFGQHFKCSFKIHTQLAQERKQKRVKKRVKKRE